MNNPMLSWFGIIRLGLVQTGLGAIVVLTTSTLNRVMVIELAMPAILPGALVAIHYALQVFRPGVGTWLRSRCPANAMDCGRHGGSRDWGAACFCCYGLDGDASAVRRRARGRRLRPDWRGGRRRRDVAVGFAGQADR